VFEATALLLSGLGPLVVLFAAIATPTTASSLVLGSVLLAIPLSLSRIWRVREKVIGTLLLIGGSIGLPFLMHLYDQTSHVKGTSAALLTTVLVVGSVPFLATTAYLWQSPESRMIRELSCPVRREAARKRTCSTGTSPCGRPYPLGS
jgi:hypothetical protein